MTTRVYWVQLVALGGSLTLCILGIPRLYYSAQILLGVDICTIIMLTFVASMCIRDLREIYRQKRAAKAALLRIKGFEEHEINYILGGPDATLERY